MKLLQAETMKRIKASIRQQQRIEITSKICSVLLSMKNAKKNILLTLLICNLQSCSNITHVPIPVGGFNRDEEPTLTPEEQSYFDVLTEKHLEEVTACKHLGTATGEGGGGLAGRWRAKKLVKYEAAKHKADTIVFGPDPAWEFSKTFVTGGFYQCHNARQAD